MSENKDMEKKLATTALTVSLVLASILISISTTGLAVTQDAKKNVSVNVSIATEVSVDVEPKTLVYSGASVGTQYNQTDRQYRGVTIENTGSEYIDQIWINSSMPGTRPFGTGKPSSYNAGNFLQVLPNMSSKDVTGANAQNYYFVNRREFKIPDSSVPSYIVAPEDQITFPEGPSVSDQNGAIHISRFRRGDESIWYMLATSATDGGNNDCDGSSAYNVIRVGNTPATPAQLGTVDFTDDGPDGEPADYTEYDIEQLSNSAGYGIANGSVSLPFEDASPAYDLLTNCDTETHHDSVRTRYAVDTLDTQDLTTAGFESEFIIQAGDTAQNMLLPGDTVPLEMAIEVPTGVAEGEVSQGTMTVFATANTTATVN
jgi:hypothetical protein